MDTRIEVRNSEISGEESVHTDQSDKKPYASPKLTRYGQMSKLTSEGGGDGPNDGDDLYGRPIS